ncbi:MAG: CRTAC1 family protein, partial [Planctomycetaceae bacterium]|nr:CRTAC1 family protein [Planctomycetaceae bacterium]
NVRQMDFGQSCTAGDFDNDGFPDLYVANIGQNALLLNNGDGTFTELKPPASAPLNWTSSVAIVDMNHDGDPDLVDVNYVSGDGVYTRTCEGESCSPNAFNGTADQIHLSDGLGGFQTVTGSADPRLAKGMGLIVFRESRDQPISILVGNDQTPKYQLQLQHQSNDGWLLTDVAPQTGLAYNGEGVQTAAMGIAADDIDGNGLTDFFIVNFRDEANTLYIQEPGGVFRDVARPAGMDTPGYAFVGWGTQFLDADLDGDTDVVISNGHVDDYRDKGEGFAMRSQLFRGISGARFEELSAEQSGPFFAKEIHGRGLARLDWNRDGLPEFVVSCIASPAELVTNQTRQPGHQVTLRLIATATPRDAFLTIATAETSSGQQTHQLYAGDGYHACNQRTLQMGLGNSEAIESVRVRWPSGTETTITSPPVDCTLTCVEGREAAYTLKEADMATTLHIKTSPAQ